MARVIYETATEVFRVVIRYQYEGNDTEYTTVLGPYEKLSTARGQLSRYVRYGWRRVFNETYIERSTTTWEKVG